jgi:hypothetical protein
LTTDYDIYIPSADIEDSGDHHGLLLEYETLKSYMITQNVSLGAICQRNCIAGVQKIDIFKAWVSKKIQRISIAHPEVLEPIENDNVFLKNILKSGI